MTSQPLSLSHRIATDVSSPPEYARTSFLFDMGQEVFERLARPPLSKHGDDRVVAGNSAGNTGQGGLVDAARNKVRGSWGRPDHDHRLDELDRQHELADKRSRASIAANRTDEA